MAADLGEFNSDETDIPLRIKRRSFAATMGAHDDSSSLGASPMTAPSRNTPPQTSLALEGPMLDSFITPSPSNTNSPGAPSNRQFGGLDNDIAKFAQSVIIPLISPFVRAKLTSSLLLGLQLYVSPSILFRFKVLMC